MRIVSLTRRLDVRSLAICCTGRSFWLNRRDVRASLLATLLLRVGSGIVVGMLLAAAGDAYKASWWYVFHQPAGVKIIVLPQLTFSGVPGLLITPWLHWDANYFVGLATSGYSSANSAFLPLYPALTRISGVLLGGHFTLGALLVSSVATFVTFLALYRLSGLLTGDPQVAYCSVVLAAALPLAFYFVAPYSESLYLALSLTAIIAALDSRWALVALLAAAASLTRQQGPLLGILALPALKAPLSSLLHDTSSPLFERLTLFWVRSRGPLLALAAGGLAYLCWLVILSKLIGVATPYDMLTSARGWGQHFAVPGTAILADIAFTVRNPLTSITIGRMNITLDVTASLLALAGLALAYRRFPLPLWLYMVACWCLATAKVDSDGHTTSTARYLLALLPLVVLPALWFVRTSFAPRIAYVAVSVALFACCFVQWLLWFWVS